VCKDYKTTGFCGFGDSCKFLHAREDYKAGHQLEKEWDETQKKKRQTMDLQLKSFGEGGDIDMSNGSGSGSGSGTGTGDGDAAGGNKGTDVPFACHICRKPFEDPIVTLCGHYFCGRCVLSARSSNKCAVCKKDTFGVFNITDKVVNSKSKSKAKA
jgi:RING finger protein 113A